MAKGGHGPPSPPRLGSANGAGKAVSASSSASGSAAGRALLGGFGEHGASTPLVVRTDERQLGEVPPSPIGSRCLVPFVPPDSPQIGSSWASMMDADDVAMHAGKCSPKQSFDDPLGGLAGRMDGGSFSNEHDSSRCENLKCTQGVCGYAAMHSDGDPAISAVPNAKYDPFHFTETVRDFCPDGSTVQMDMDAARQSMGRFKHAVVGKLLGRRLPFHYLLAELTRRWQQFGDFQLIMLSADCFTCIFKSAEARDGVLLGGPWYINGFIIGLDEWSSAFSPSSLSGLSSPLWVRLPGLPLIYWDKKNLGRIAAMIGAPLWIDAITSRWERAEFARVCVRADFAKPLPAGVWINGLFGRFFQKVEYEGIASICFKCGCAGHKAESCSLHLPTGATRPSGPKAPSKLRPANGGKEKVLDDPATPQPSTPVNAAPPPPVEEDQAYGPWIIARRRRRRPKAKPDAPAPPKADRITPRTVPVPTQDCFGADHPPGGVFRAGNAQVQQQVGGTATHGPPRQEEGGTSRGHKALNRFRSASHKPNPDDRQLWWNKPIPANIFGRKKRKSEGDHSLIDGGVASPLVSHA